MAAALQSVRAKGRGWVMAGFEMLATEAALGIERVVAPAPPLELALEPQAAVQVAGDDPFSREVRAKLLD